MPGADAFNQCAGPDPGRRDEWLAGRSRWGTKCTRIRREYEENTNGIRTKNDSNTLARRMYPACTWPALPAEQGIHSAAKPQPNGRRQNHGRTESYLTDHAAPPFVVPPAMILSLFRMILSCHDSVGLLRDKKSSQPANNFDYCSRPASFILNRATVVLPTGDEPMISPPRRVKCSFQSSNRGFRLGEHPPGLGLKNPNQGAGLHVCLVLGTLLGSELALVAFSGQRFHPCTRPLIRAQPDQRAGCLQPEATADRLQHLAAPFPEVNKG